jgi:L-rhamnose mutarotase
MALDLHDDPVQIQAYENWHLPGKVWPEIVDSIRASGVTDMQIYRTGNRLFLVMETTDAFTMDTKATMDRNNPIVQQWEQLMSGFQQPLPWGGPGEKWVLMDILFQLPRT